MFKFRYFLLMCVLNFTNLSAQEIFGNVYEVTASVLMVREEPNAKARVLLKLPRGSYVLNYDDQQQSQTKEQIGGQTGRWLRVQGFGRYSIGYVFEGFLKRRTDLGYNDISDSCRVLDKKTDCGEDQFVFTVATPIAGSWYSEPGTEHGGLEYVYLKASKRLKTMLESPNPKQHWPAGANATMILEGNRVLQFVIVPTPRGFGP